MSDNDTQAEEPKNSGIGKTLKSVQTAWALKGYVPTVLYALGSHIIAGPTQTSWPASVSVIIALANKGGGMRQPSDPSKPVDPMKAVPKLRKMIQLEKILPPLRTGFAVEVAIPVKKLGLTGILEELDNQEDGSRKLLADWTIHNDVQRNMHHVTPRIVLYMHGGGYSVMSRASHRPLCVKISKALNCRVFSVEYRLSPEVVFPAALQDAIVAYKYLTDNLKIPAGNIVLGGDSAGGNLALALMLALRDLKLPQVSGAMLLSPWCDMTMSLMSWETNDLTDYLRMPPANDPLSPVNCFLGPAERRERLITHPYVSSCAADLSGLPPLLIQVGGAETLMDEGTLLAQRAATAGVDVRHELWVDGIHVAQSFPGDLSKAQIEAMAEWNAAHTNANSLSPIDLSSVDAELAREFERREQQSPKGTKAAQKAGEAVQAGVPGPREVGSKLTGRKWKFVATRKEAPAVNVRPDAHPALRAAVEENRKNRDVWAAKGVTYIYEAQALPRHGLVQNVRGLLHL